MDLGCGSTKTVDVDSIGADVMLFRFVIDDRNDMVFVDHNNSFRPMGILKDEAGRNLKSLFASKCGDNDCGGKVFSMKNMSAGQYVLELVPDGEGGPFTVDLQCAATSMGDKGNVSIFENCDLSICLIPIYIFSTSLPFLRLFLLKLPRFFSFTFSKHDSMSAS